MHLRSLLLNLLGVAFVVGLAIPADGFPPSPHFTLFGIVRDQVGQRLPANGSTEVILLRGNVEISRTPLSKSLLDQNYEMKIKVDANRPGTDLYRELAFANDAPFSVAVDINGVRFYPIEVAGTLRVGTGGERQRLDLNLGEDTDLDGLPDAWEEWQLYTMGFYPDRGGNWDLSLFSWNGDFDHDGLIDGLEYIAGTFAGDATEKFDLNILSITDGVARFNFYQIIGKLYTIETSEDGQSWRAVDFSVAEKPVSKSHQAGSIGIVSASAASPSSRALFRLTVR